MTTGHVSIRIYWLHCGGTPFKGSTEAARLSREAGLCGWRLTCIFDLPIFSLKFSLTVFNVNI